MEGGMRRTIAGKAERLDRMDAWIAKHKRRLAQVS
jgi:hypothetical protein